MAPRTDGAIRCTAVCSTLHVAVSVFARGLPHRVVTHIYFADEPEANAADPVLAVLGEPSGPA